jgi:hypothetical protein
MLSLNREESKWGHAVGVALVALLQTGVISLAEMSAVEAQALINKTTPSPKNLIGFLVINCLSSDNLSQQSSHQL